MELLVKAWIAQITAIKVAKIVIKDSTGKEKRKVVSKMFVSAPTVTQLPVQLVLNTIRKIVLQILKFHQTVLVVVQQPVNAFSFLYMKMENVILVANVKMVKPPPEVLAKNILTRIQIMNYAQNENATKVIISVMENANKMFASVRKEPKQQDQTVQFTTQ